jgi:hypothetical protein
MMTSPWRIAVPLFAALAVLAIWGCAEDGMLIEMCSDGSVADPFVGCPVDDDDPDDPDDEGIQPTLASIQQHVFTPLCATSGCHNDTPGNPMPLRDEAESYTNLVGAFSFYCVVPRVDPGNPDNSCLVFAIEGANGWYGNNARMPPPPSALTQEQIDAIRQWITDGALP